MCGRLDDKAWDKVWDNGHPKNVRYGMQTIDVAPAHAVIADIVSPSDRPTNNALVVGNRYKEDSGCEN